MKSPLTTTDRAPNATRERRVFEGFLLPGEDRVRVTEIFRILANCGLRPDDPRLAPIQRLLHMRDAGELSYDDFLAQVRPCMLILEQALTGALVIPEFGSFCADIDAVFEAARSERGGKVADYIPKLSRADPERYGLSLCTIDGQRESFGDASMPFSAQCMHKPMTYSRALEDCGHEALHARIGCEPSGRSFNDIVLDDANRPHNPMLNAGSIMCSAMIRPESHISDRFEHVVDLWQAMAGGERPGFDNATYLSERRTTDRNNALTYFMREHGAFPENSDAFDALDLYLQSCSLEVTTELMANVAATLAAGGICPLTGERVLMPETVQKSLSFMYSCGMYDYSGRWAFQIGLPAKSGVSGGVMIIVPNVMGLCVWSPPLEPHGNSQRGIEFARRLVERFNFHVYDGLGGVDTGKTDPRRRSVADERQLLVDLCWAASEGDCDGIQRLLVRGADVNAADYDGRTPLHLAASEGRIDAVAALLNLGALTTSLDRWGNTAEVDARREGHAEVAEILNTWPKNSASVADGRRAAGNGVCAGEVRTADILQQSGRFEVS